MYGTHPSHLRALGVPRGTTRGSWGQNPHTAFWLNGAVWVARNTNGHCLGHPRNICPAADRYHQLESGKKIRQVFLCECGNVLSPHFSMAGNGSREGLGGGHSPATARIPPPNGGGQPAQEVATHFFSNVLQTSNCSISLNNWTQRPRFRPHTAPVTVQTSHSVCETCHAFCGVKSEKNRRESLFFSFFHLTSWNLVRPPSRANLGRSEVDV